MGSLVYTPWFHFLQEDLPKQARSKEKKNSSQKAQPRPHIIQWYLFFEVKNREGHENRESDNFLDNF